MLAYTFLFTIVRFSTYALIRWRVLYLTTNPPAPLPTLFRDWKKVNQDPPDGYDSRLSNSFHIKFFLSCTRDHSCHLLTEYLCVWYVFMGQGAFQPLNRNNELVHIASLTPFLVLWFIILIVSNQTRIISDCNSIPLQKRFEHLEAQLMCAQALIRFFLRTRP